MNKFIIPVSLLAAGLAVVAAVKVGDIMQKRAHVESSAEKERKEQIKERWERLKNHFRRTDGGR